MARCDTIILVGEMSAMRFESVNELIETIENRRSFRENRNALQGFLEEYGNPQFDIKTVHIAGTNGKGSTTNYISYILMAQGYTVGMFTSPYLVSHFDRIRVNDMDIPGEIMLDLANEYWQSIEEYELNMFEIDFVLSLFYFKKMNVDFAIYEVGMGGRLDATNSILPLVCGITNIGMDHMQYLGDTYEKIAYEKAGIMKPDVTCFTTEKREESLESMKWHADTVGARLEEVSFLNVKSYPPLILNSDYGDLELGDVALYQRKNVSLALAMIAEIKRLGFDVSDEAIVKGVQTIWKGRFERVRENVYLDGAHNVEGVEALCQSIDAIRGDKTVRIVFACLKDKPFASMLKHLKEHCDTLVLTCIDVPRACKSEDYGEGYIVVEDYQRAIEEALKSDDLVFITGSLYFITEAKKYLSM